MELKELKTKLAQRKNLALEKRVKNNLVLAQISDISKRKSDRSSKLELVKKAHEFVDKVATSKRTDMKDKISLVVTEALKLIYGPEYELLISYSSKANRSYLDIEVKKTTPDGDVIRDMCGFGGGVSDSISVPMRIMIVTTSGQDRILFLDEAYKGIGIDRVEHAGEFLKFIAKKMNMQIVLLTHYPDMLSIADKGICLSSSDDGVVVGSR